VEVEALHVVVATHVFNGQGIAPEPLNWVLFHIVLGDPERFEFLGEKQIAKPCRVGGKVVAIADFGSLLRVADLVDPVASMVATVCVVSGVAVRLASASTIATATSSYVATMGGTVATATPVAAATTPTFVDTM
jgi:hypothetical protein